MSGCTIYFARELVGTFALEAFAQLFIWHRVPHSPALIWLLRMIMLAPTCRFKDGEVLEIIKRSFALLLDRSRPDEPEEEKNWGPITRPQLEKVYHLHLQIITLVGQRDIGRSGGPFEFNLRDLIKLRDVLEGNAHNMRDHYRFLKSSTALANEADERSSVTHAELPDDVRTITLNKFVSLVYARRFQSRADQRRVQDLIDQAQYLGTSNDFMDVANPEVDASVPGMVRIGTVYLTQGTCEASGAGQSTPTRLVHSPDTVERLEALAAAVQSRRAVLLEGDTCSGKTALVKELARLCKRRLVVIPMTHDIETSDLIGQWLPSTSLSQEANKLDGCIRELKEASNLLLFYIIPCLSVAESNPDIDALKDTVRDAFAIPVPTAQVVGEENPTSATYALTQMEETMRACARPGVEGIPAYLSLACTHAAGRLKRAQKNFERSQAKEDEQDSLEGVVGREGPKISFEFVESQLVTAVRQGAWVLLDNINSAPPEVIERLNSLLEDEPTLNLIEMGSGEELTRDNGGIHPDLRIFATANTRRIGSNKMSSALLNRLLRLWLPPLDDGLADVGSEAKDLEAHDLFFVVLDMLPNFPGKVKVAHLLLRFHAIVKGMVDTEPLTLVGDAQITFRTCMRTISCAITAMRTTRGRALNAFVWSILRNYVDCVRTHDGGQDHALKLRTQLCTLLKSAMIRDALGSSLNAARSGASSSPWLVDHDDLRQAMAAVETLLQRALAMLMRNSSPQRFMTLTRSLLSKGFVSEGHHSTFRDELRR